MGIMSEKDILAKKVNNTKPGSAARKTAYAALMELEEKELCER